MCQEFHALQEFHTFKTAKMNLYFRKINFLGFHEAMSITLNFHNQKKYFKNFTQTNLSKYIYIE